LLADIWQNQYDQIVI